MTPIQMDILRRVLLPVLADDECYPPGELPRRMTDDEVRDGTGQAFWMALRSGVVIIGASYDWVPGGQAADNHPAHIPSQLARLQAFWDANQPKEAELNLSWSTGRRWVHVSWGDNFCFYTGDGWSAENTLSPSQRATVEAFFAAGPPVELAEDEFVLTGIRYQMRIHRSGDMLEVHKADKDWKGGGYSRGGLERAALEHPDPLGWPRALAYFDRHVGKPARVTDVRFIGEEKCVNFVFRNLTRYYAGKWNTEEFKAALHPQDIALIERCWAEGRLGEREVLDDQGKPWNVRLANDGSYVCLCRRAPTREYTLSLSRQEMAAETPSCWTWIRDDQTITFHDSTQRARVRAIVAGLKESTAGPASKQTNGGASAASGAARAVVTEAHSVTPSGEAKAPEEGLKPSWRQAEYDIRGRGTLFISYSKERGGWVVEAMRETDAGHGEVDQDIKEIQFLRAAPAPALTELREAWENWAPGRSSLDGFNELLAAVERLVGKP